MDHCTTYIKRKKTNLNTVSLIILCNKIILYYILRHGYYIDIYITYKSIIYFSESFFITFSFPANIKRLFLASNKTENLSCIDILKTHACVLVIIGQRMLYTTGQPLENPKKIEEVSNEWCTYMSLINIIDYVDNKNYRVPIF